MGEGEMPVSLWSSSSFPFHRKSIIKMQEAMDVICGDESRPNQAVEWQGFVLLFPCFYHIWFVYPNVSLSLFTTFYCLSWTVSGSKLLACLRRRQIRVSFWSLECKALGLQEGLVATAKALPSSHFHLSHLNFCPWSNDHLIGQVNLHFFSS